MGTERHTRVGGPATVDAPESLGDATAELRVRLPRAPAPEVRRAVSGRVSDDALLDAARECVLANGVRRTTLTDIARAAGVSRMTVYRRYSDVHSVLAALMTREFGALLRSVAEPAEAEPSRTARRRVVDIAVAAVRALAADPLLRTVLDRDAALLVPYVTDRLGATQRLAEDVLCDLVTRGHADGSVRRGEPGVQVRTVLLVVQSFVLSHRPATADVSDEALLAELAHLLDAALAAPHDPGEERVP